MRGKHPLPPVPVSSPLAEKCERIYIKKKAPAPPPPPIPPKPPSPKVRKRAPPIRPPAPKIDLMDVNYVEDPQSSSSSSKDDIESLYARVKKDSIRPER